MMGWLDRIAPRKREDDLPVAALMWLLHGEAGGSQLASPFLVAVRASMSASDIERAEKLATAPLAEPVS